MCERSALEAYEPTVPNASSKPGWAVPRSALPGFLVSSVIIRRERAKAMDLFATAIEELEENKTFSPYKGLVSAMERFEQWKKKFRENDDGLIRIRTNENLTSEEGHGQQLLPAIPDELTLNVIIPKLPWRALQTLMCVSRVWKQAYETRQVYAARVHAHATERFDVTQEHLFFFGNRVIVRSKRDDGLCYVLPSIPRVDNQRIAQYNIRSLDGKIYAAGGRRIQKLFVLDLAGKKRWKECASMQEPREDVDTKAGGVFNLFQYHVKDGKLYVFGGVRYFKKAPWARDGGCEVYDPMVDSWSLKESELKPWELKWDESFLEV